MCQYSGLHLGAGDPSEANKAVAMMVGIGTGSYWHRQQTLLNASKCHNAGCYNLVAKHLAG